MGSIRTEKRRKRMKKTIVSKAMLFFLAMVLILSSQSFAAAEGIKDNTGRRRNDFQDEWESAESARINTGNGPGGERPTDRFGVTLPDEPPETGFYPTGQDHFGGRMPSEETMRPAHPAQAMRPRRPAQTVRPADPAQSLRPRAPVQSMRPRRPAGTMRPADPMQR
jgi:hypothetical protein